MSAETTNETTTRQPSLSESSPDESSPRATFVVTGLVSLCAATQFAIQAYMSYGFARHVWGIPSLLSAAVIVGVDLFVTVYMVLTYLMRTARWRTKFYVWGVLFAGIGTQLFAAELFARYSRWTFPVEIFAATPALALAASLHGLIKYRQHIGTVTPRPRPVRLAMPKNQRPARTEQAPQHEKRGQESISKTPLPPRPTSPPAPPPVSSGRSEPVRSRRGNPHRDEAVRRVLAGEEAARVARELGLGARNVQNWAKAARRAASRSGGSESPIVQVAAPDAPVPKEINGAGDQLLQVARLKDDILS